MGLSGQQGTLTSDQQFKKHHLRSSSLHSLTSSFPVLDARRTSAPLDEHDCTHASPHRAHGACG